MCVEIFKIYFLHNYLTVVAKKSSSTYPKIRQNQHLKSRTNILRDK